jgi:penicillin amidase
MIGTMSRSTSQDPPATGQGQEHWLDIFRALPAFVRWLVWGVVGLVLLLVLVMAAGTGMVRQTFPDEGGSLDVPGLDARVEVVRDEHGIPQVYASTLDDLMRAQGFVHAQ